MSVKPRPFPFWISFLLVLGIGAFPFAASVENIGATDCSGVSDLRECINSSLSQLTTRKYIAAGSYFTGVVALSIGSISFLIHALKQQKQQNEISSTATINTPSRSVKPLEASAAPSNLEQELQKAADMLKNGLIDEDEYKELKKKIISKS